MDEDGHIEVGEWSEKNLSDVKDKKIPQKFV